MLLVEYMGNPESMRPTPASKTRIVIEANKVILQTADKILSTEMLKPKPLRNKTLLERLTNFIG